MVSTPIIHSITAKQTENPARLCRCRELPVILHTLFNFSLLTRTAYLSVFMLTISSFIFHKWYKERRVFEIKLHEQKFPLSPPFLSGKSETDVCLSKENTSLDFIKKLGLGRFGSTTKHKKKK